MRDILIPTDFSPAAQNAVDYAFSLFRGESCAFHFLNTYTPDFIHSRVLALTHSGSLEEDPMQSASEEGLKNLVADLASRYPNSGHEFRTVSSFNLLTEEIREQLELQGIDLVLSGTTGASGLKEVFLGSNTVRILKAVTDTPVLVVPQESKWKRPAKIGMVTDLFSPYTAKQIETILFFARQLRARVEVMHIGSPDGLNAFQELHKHQLFLELERLEPKMHWRWPQGSKTAVIEEYLGHEKVDLLIMIRNDHHLVEEWVREPVVKKIAFHTRVPMLVLPPA
ncbi:universal stress protein [Robiginitalea marina]|uniref:Universal stress protein n=1 Tax=Robiginitalea marina TaxID=2954105 RepID=A0ABT1AY82_9FLAO|nr:universal stress protein [Robiginitalea marina]MCO5724956.1 universal stress protein [Robiginitalea marina]